MLKGLLKTLPMDCPARRLDMVVAGWIHIEVPVHQVVDVHLFGCELQHLQSLSLRCAGGGQKAKRLNGSAACATFCVSTSVYTFEKRHEGICHISHAVDTSASSELKAR